MPDRYGPVIWADPDALRPATFHFGVMASITADGVTTFDWPAIERAAKSDREPGRMMARLLLAARSAGVEDALGTLVKVARNVEQGSAGRGGGPP